MTKDIQLRDAELGDYDFLYDLHRQSLRQYIHQTWGWEDGWQADYFRENFDLSGKKIIQLEGEDIGCLQVINKGEHLFLAYIALLPPYQGQGTGTRLIETVLEKARERSIPVELKVLKTNPARRLYERLGFFVTRISNTHYFMRYDHQPGSGA